MPIDLPTPAVHGLDPATLAAALDHAADALVVTDAGGVDRGPAVLYANATFLALFAIEAADALGQDLTRFEDWAGPSLDRNRLRGALRSGEPFTGEVVGERPDGTAFVAELRLNPVRTDKGVTTHHVGVLRDISEHKRVAERLTHLAHHDALTGLPNRKLFLDRLDQALRRARRYRGGVGVLFIDLDGFKPVNDTHGHDTGDAVLVEVARRLEGLLRSSDTVARLGGDEFTLVLPGLQSRDDAGAIATKVVQVIAQPYAVGELSLHLTTSIGIAVHPTDGADVDALVRNADLAMYRAKQSGKNQAVFYDASEDEQRGAELDAALRAAVEQDGLEVLYAPVLDTRSGQVLGAEAYPSFRHADDQLDTPRLVQRLTLLGLAPELGDRLLARVLRDVATWPLPRHFVVDVDLLPGQLDRTDLVAQIGGLLRGSGVDASRLRLNLAERDVATPTDALLDRLWDLHELGLRLAIDRYGGTGLPMRVLRDLPAELLKIDPDLVRDHAKRATVLRGIVVLAHSSGLEVGAEGVATPEARAAMEGLGCEWLQGDGIGPAVDGTSFAASLPEAG